MTRKEAENLKGRVRHQRAMLRFYAEGGGAQAELAAFLSDLFASSPDLAGQVVASAMAFRRRESGKHLREAQNMAYQKARAASEMGKELKALREKAQDVEA